MVKIKRLRQKYHLSLSKSDSPINQKETAITSQDNTTSNKPVKQDFSFPDNIFPDNIFKGLNIDAKDVQQIIQEDYVDKRSNCTKKNIFKNQNLKKVDKRKTRRDMFVNKLTLTKHLNDKAKEKKEREKTVITGDLNPLLESLNQIEDKEKEKKKKTKEPKKRGIMKANHRQKNMLQDISLIQKILVNPTYKKNPFGCISDIVRERLNRENDSLI